MVKVYCRTCCRYYSAKTLPTVDGLVFCAMGIVLRRLRLEYWFVIQTCRVSGRYFQDIFRGEMSEIGLVKIYFGKVRDLYEIDDKRMLMVASDRLSAFDVILDDPIPSKGEILTQISNFWFKNWCILCPTTLPVKRFTMFCLKTKPKL